MEHRRAMRSLPALALAAVACGVALWPSDGHACACGWRVRAALCAAAHRVSVARVVAVTDECDHSTLRLRTVTTHRGRPPRARTVRMGVGTDSCGTGRSDCDVRAHPVGTLLAIIEGADGLEEIGFCSPVYPTTDETFDACSAAAIRAADAELPW